MAQKNRADLTTEANVIKNESVAKRNTALRVGNMLVNLIDSLLTFLDDAGNFLLKSSTEPNTWYVNTNGDDSNVGSDKFPFETIQAAHDAASPFDVIVIQNPDFSQPSSPSTIITKDGLVIKGIATNFDNQAVLRGVWTITAGIALRFDDIALSVIIESTSLFTIYITNCSTTGLETRTSRDMFLFIQNSKVDFGSVVNIRSLEAYNSRLTDNINIGRNIKLYDSTLIGDCVSGIDAAQPMELRNSTIEGNVTVTGDLEKFNSVITGSETVSGTTTNRQAKVFDDSVEFKDKVSIGVSAFLNLLDVAGGVAIGSAYAGVQTAPTDGLLVEGNIGQGVTIPLNNIHIGLPSGVGNLDQGFELSKGDGFFKAVNGTSGNNTFVPSFQGKSDGSFHLGLLFDGTEGSTINAEPVILFRVRENDGSGTIDDANVAFGFENFTTRLMTILGDGNTGFSTATPLAKVDINQSSATAAEPALKLTQADLSEEMIKFDATIGTGNPIEAIGAKSFTQTHFLKINVEGLGVKYMPIGDLA